MEELVSSSDSDTSDSEEYSKAVEEELYSVLHHNDFSQGIPPELLEKYSISTDNKNEFVISFKRSHSSKSSVGKDEEVRSGRKLDDSDDPSSSNDDVVVLSDESDHEVTPCHSKNRISERVVEEYSDSGDSSVNIIEMSRKRKYPNVLDGSVITLSSDDENVDLSINTMGEMGDDSDGNVSDVVGKSTYKWKNVASPSTWTEEMRKYYNSACDQLRYFDHKKIRLSLPSGSIEDWTISRRDLYPDRRPRPRCDICRQTDHIARNCPKQNPTCHMCGVEGHSNIDCPNSICLQCGKKNSQFTSTCRSCAYMSNRECFTCKQRGHESKFCPEKWRDFHSTVEGSLKKQERGNKNGSFQCCNCGDTNHLFEECNQQYLSSYAKSLPAYAWLHGRGGGYSDWRYSGHGGSPGNAEPPRKRRKFSPKVPYQGTRSPDDFEPSTPHNGSGPRKIPPWYLQRFPSHKTKKTPRRRKKDRMNGKGMKS